MTSTRQLAAKVSLIAERDGVLDEDLLFSMLALPTARGYAGGLVPGNTVRRTVDLLTSPGRLVLAADNARAATMDYRTIRAPEASGLYAGTASR
ncbi:hypothetical protein ACLQ18_43020 [Streptomyces sp. DT193]|uniref:hypothetical protein n=1 Tax=Streptomyces sp. DT193 TaxID=3393418 RepID=UPI003CF39492